MQFISTRGNMEPCGFTDVLLAGLAPDGGLAVPDHLPNLSHSDLESLRDLSYPHLAATIIGLFASDIPPTDLASLTQAAYGPERFPSPVVPVRSLEQLRGGLHVVGLSEGPTMAFKDLAMQFLGQAIPYVLRQRNQVLNIVGATSGDTGSAAEYAFRGQEGVSVFMLSPQGRMSDVQRAQMYSLREDNIHNITVEGVFDDCQNLVKAINQDAAFKDRYSIGAVNSINFGRIAAQVVYYVWTWLRASDSISDADRPAFRIDVAVPSGNFGNIYAAHVARSMGIPLRRLILATNENNVLDEFFSTGMYRPRSAEATLVTSSPSMDISRASNLERFIYALLGPEEFQAAWSQLLGLGVLDLSNQVVRMREDFGFVSTTSTHSDRLAAIRQVYESCGQLIDPHTADGITAALRLGEPGFPTFVMETAQAAKFADTVGQALGHAAPTSSAIKDLLALPQHVTPIPNDVATLKDLIAASAVRV